MNLSLTSGLYLQVVSRISRNLGVEMTYALHIFDRAARRSRTTNMSIR
jgi:hypothetical protein